MAGLVLDCRPSVQDDDAARPCPIEQFLHADGLGVGAVPEVLAHEAIEIGEASLSHGMKGGAEIEDRGIDEPVIDEEALFAALDQRGLSERLQMLRGIRQRQAHLGREGIDGAFALGEQFKHLDAVRAGEGFAEASELTVKAILEGAVGVSHSQVINRVL
jgi:hypothetical protein